MKIIKSMKEFEKRYFPKEYKNKQREELIKEKGIGFVLAQETLNKIKKEL